MWSFPLIVITIFLLQTVSKPDMPHFTLPVMEHPVQNDPVLPAAMLAFQ